MANCNLNLKNQLQFQSVVNSEELYVTTELNKQEFERRYSLPIKIIKILYYTHLLVVSGSVLIIEL